MNAIAGAQAGISNGVGSSIAYGSDALAGQARHRLMDRARSGGDGPARQPIQSVKRSTPGASGRSVRIQMHDSGRTIHQIIDRAAKKVIRSTPRPRALDTLYQARDRIFAQRGIDLLA